MENHQKLVYIKVGPVQLSWMISYSDTFPILRGVRQGSLLSPALFLLVMDPLLKQLEAYGVGFCVNSYYAGYFLHADDIIFLILF